MNRLDRKIRVAGLLLALVALLCVAPSFATEQQPASDQPAPAAQNADAEKSEGVTFVNRSRETQNVLAVYGGEKCEDMTEKAQVAIEPGQSSTVASGDQQVCWCASTLGKVGNCTVWSKAKPGKSVTIR